VRVDYVVVLIPAVLDGFAHLVLVGPTGAEDLANLGQQLFRNLVRAPLVEVVHQHGDQAGVALGQVVQHALQVGGDEDVHRGGDGLEERALTVVGTGGQEVEQNVVLVGSHHEVLDRQAEQLGVVAGEDIAEVAGRDHELDLIANVDHLIG